MGKTRDLFKKIRATKGTFHAKMGSIKDRSALKGETVPDSLPATPRSPPTRRVPPRGTPRVTPFAPQAQSGCQVDEGEGGTG